MHNHGVGQKLHLGSFKLGNVHISYYAINKGRGGGGITPMLTTDDMGEGAVMMSSLIIF